MGLLSALRKTVADAVGAALGPRPLELRCVSPDGANATIYVATRNGLKITVARDYPPAPWSWCVEDARDARIIAFRGSAGMTYDEAARSVSEWLASSDGQASQGTFDEPPRAA